jgi:hypothetical protein
MLIDKLISWPPHPLFIKHAISPPPPPPGKWEKGKKTSLITENKLVICIIIKDYEGEFLYMIMNVRIRDS